MAAYLCTICGAGVRAEAARDIRTATRHGRDAGHPDGGPCPANSAHARRLRVRRPATGGTIRQAFPSRARTIRQASPSRAPRRWDGVPLHSRVVIFLMAVGVVSLTGAALADALDDTSVLTSCHDRIAC